MTEMSPLGTVCNAEAQAPRAAEGRSSALLVKQGRAIFGVEMQIVDADGSELPWDGKAAGDLLVRGPWIVSRYFKDEGGDPLVRSTAAGSRPATSPRSTPTASCRSPTAART